MHSYSLSLVSSARAANRNTFGTRDRRGYPRWVVILSNSIPGDIRFFTRISSPIEAYPQ